MATVTSTFQKRPCYKYIRESDKLPTEIHPEAEAKDIICKVRLFNPTGIGTWWIASYDPESQVAFGVAELHEREVCSIWMPELVEYRGGFGLPIERDLYWSPKTMQEIVDGAK